MYLLSKFSFSVFYVVALNAIQFFVAVHFELKKKDRNIFTSFFLQNRKILETEKNAN